jgi:putative transposase
MAGQKRKITDFFGSAPITVAVPTGSSSSSASPSPTISPWWTPAIGEKAKAWWFQMQGAPTSSLVRSIPSPYSNELPIRDWWCTADQTISPLLSAITVASDPISIEPSPNQEKTAMRSRRYPLHPTPEQKRVLLGWLGGARWTYNHCLSLVENRAGTPDALPKLDGKGKGKEKEREKEKEKENENKVAKNAKTLRPLALNSDSPALQENPWLADTPFNIRDDAMRDLLKAYKTCFSQKGSKRIAHFSLKYRSRKDPSQTLSIQAKYCRAEQKDFFPSFFAKAGIPSFIGGMEAVPFPLNHDCRLQRTRLGEWYFIVPEDRAIRQTHQNGGKKRWLAIDPGVRTFASCYDAAGVFLEFGAGDIQRIHRLCYAYDDLQSRWTAVNARARYRMKRAGLRIQRRIRGLTDDAHRKICKYLCERYDEILLPRFETQQMVEKRNATTGKKRCIRGKTARAMLTWRHWTFQQRLIAKAEECGTRVTLCTEEYTSKTCGGCGRLKWNLGGAKRFKCSYCDYVAPRDFNGARNILLKCAPPEYLRHPTSQIGHGLALRPSPAT